MSTSSSGRERQRQRTRTALLDAAVAMIREGTTPTIAEVAERADISRATAYRYFPAQDLMLTEAVLHEAVPDIPALLASVGDDPAHRIDLVTRYVYRWVAERDAGFRAFLRQSLDPAGSDSPGASEETLPGRRRGGRRIAWIEEALEPLRAEMDPERFRMLAAAISLFMGIETRIVLGDIWEMDDAEAEQVARWATTALLRQAMDE